MEEARIGLEGQDSTSELSSHTAALCFCDLLSNGLQCLWMYVCVKENSGDLELINTFVDMTWNKSRFWDWLLSNTGPGKRIMQEAFESIGSNCMGAPGLPQRMPSPTGASIQPEFTSHCYHETWWKGVVWVSEELTEIRGQIQDLFSHFLLIAYFNISQRIIHGSWSGMFRELIFMSVCKVVLIQIHI